MGASGIGPLENDSAEDLCDELREAGPDEQLELIRDALRAAASTPAGAYLQKDVGETAVAAAALAVATRSGRPSLLGELAAVPDPDLLDVEVPDEILHLVVAAAHRVVQDDSEVRQLWGGTGAADEWARTVQSLAAAASAGLGVTDIQ